MMKAMLAKYRPRVISGEYNVNFACDVAKVCNMSCKGHGTGGARSIYGASLGAWYLAARDHGYVVVHAVVPVDVFLVRDLARCVFLFCLVVCRFIHCSSRRSWPLNVLH